MVFYYQIRGGPCKGDLKHITLQPADIVCYVGRDKHENESLIAYGWPGDVWFHVEGYSSAHVYFRLNYAVASKNHPNIPFNGAIPIDYLPDDAVEDMKQIVKHNSIMGSKMSSCKIVWTPHSNLKKTFDMESGAVTYHDYKLRRFGRCHKDRRAIKRLEKTKSIDHTDVDFYQQMKDNERALVERRKQQRQKQYSAEDNGGVEIYDPVHEDRRAIRIRGSQQGDQNSGLDQGIVALESLNLQADTFGDQGVVVTGDGEDQKITEYIPVWQQELDQYEKDFPDNEVAIFLLERGYERAEFGSYLRKGADPVSILATLWKQLGNHKVSEADVDSDEYIASARQEERDVLDAIFGEEAEWLGDDQSNCLDSSVPITAYEPPRRYWTGSSAPPELRLEIYMLGSNYPYCKSPPVLALVGGGLPQSCLKEMTKLLYEEAVRRATEEEPGDPQLFTLISHAAEIWEDVVNAEGEALKAVRAHDDIAPEVAPPEATPMFKSEADRRAYAASVLSQNYR